MLARLARSVNFCLTHYMWILEPDLEVLLLVFLKSGWVICPLVFLSSFGQIVWLFCLSMRRWGFYHWCQVSIFRVVKYSRTLSLATLLVPVGQGVRNFLEFFSPCSERWGLEYGPIVVFIVPVEPFCLFFEINFQVLLSCCLFIVLWIWWCGHNFEWCCNPGWGN